MSKEQEALEKLLSFAFVMSENMVGLTKGNYDEATFIKKTYEYLHEYIGNFECRDILKSALQRLESIDNAKPNEALEWLDKFKGIEISALPFKDDCGTQEVDLNEVRFVGSQLNNDFHKFVNTIELNLLRAQYIEKETIEKVVKILEKFRHYVIAGCSNEEYDNVIDKIKEII